MDNEVTENQSQDFLSDRHHEKADIRLARRAAINRWSIPDEKRPAVVDRMHEIVIRRSVTIYRGDGEALESTYHADQNAVRAAQVLVAMDGLNQADEHLAEKYARVDAGQATDRIASVEIVSPLTKRISAQVVNRPALPSEPEQNDKDVV